MEELVINKARTLFFSYGLKSISMDDLAKGAGMSKKTIYQSVKDKNDLVEKVVEDLMQCHHTAMQRTAAEAKHAVEEVVKQVETSFVALASITPGFFYELEKFFPAVWQKLITYRQQVYLPAIVKNIKRGIAEGYYRQDLDIAFTAVIRLQQITTALNPQAFAAKSNTQQLMQDFSHFYLHAITNAKGKKIINTYLKQNNEKQSA